jgi:hypothetical protein
MPSMTNCSSNIEFTNRLATGSVAWAVVAGAALAHPPWGIVVNDHDQVFFCDLNRDGGSVWRCQRDGAHLTEIVRDHHSHDLAIDAHGDLIISHLQSAGDSGWESSLWRRSAETGALTALIRPTRDVHEFWADAYAVRANGSIVFATDKRLFVRAIDGTISPLTMSAAIDATAGLPATASATLRPANASQPASRPAAQFTAIRDLAAGRDGSILVIDDHALRRVSSAGELATIAEGLGLDSEDAAKKPTDNVPQNKWLFGLDVDDRGNAYIAAYTQRRILKVTDKGAVSTVLQAEAPWSPTGVACHKDELFVLEEGFRSPNIHVGVRIRRVDADGSVHGLALVETATPTNSK